MPLALAPSLPSGQIVFLVWVDLSEQKWVILAERRGTGNVPSVARPETARENRHCTVAAYALVRLRAGPFQGPATEKPPALPEDGYETAIRSFTALARSSEVSRTGMYHMGTALFSMYSSAFDFDGRR